MSDLTPFEERYLDEVERLDHRQGTTLGEDFDTEALAALEEVPINYRSDLLLSAAIALGRGAPIRMPARDDEYAWIDAPVADALAITMDYELEEVENDDPLADPQYGVRLSFDFIPLVEVADDPHHDGSVGTIGENMLTERLHTAMELVEFENSAGERQQGLLPLNMVDLGAKLLLTANAFRGVMGAMASGQLFQVRPDANNDEETLLVRVPINPEDMPMWVSVWTDCTGATQLDAVTGIAVAGPELDTPVYEAALSAMARRLEIVETADLDLGDFSIADLLGDSRPDGGDS